MRTLKEIMTTNVVTVTKQDNIYEAAVKMRDNDIGFVPVVDGGRVIGVITDRDLVIRGYAEKHSGSTSVDQVMTSDCVRVSSDTTVDEASRLMAEKRIRRLVVEDNNELAGVIAIGDLARRDKFEDEAGQALGQISEPKKEMIGSSQ